jgi:hypothetical protein
MNLIGHSGGALEHPVSSRHSLSAEDGIRECRAVFRDGIRILICPANKLFVLTTKLYDNGAVTGPALHM